MHNSCNCVMKKMSKNICVCLPLNLVQLYYINLNMNTFYRIDIELQLDSKHTAKQ